MNKSELKEEIKDVICALVADGCGDNFTYTPVNGEPIKDLKGVLVSKTTSATSADYVRNVANTMLIVACRDGLDPSDGDCIKSSSGNEYLVESVATQFLGNDDQVGYYKLGLVSQV